MKSLHELCKPRESVFDSQKRDTVLDLTDLADDRIDPAEFFTENYVTEGMKTLLEHGMRRLEGKTDQGVFKLKQAMGGGKTHNLLALGLLARHPKFREKVMDGFYKSDPSPGAVKVVAFTGRESDAPLGIWGVLAEQLDTLVRERRSYNKARRRALARLNSGLDLRWSPPKSCGRSFATGIG